LLIDIQNKGMISTCCLKNKFLIGCKEGSVFEIDMDNLRVEKTFKADTAVNSIEHLDEFLADTFVIS
jgi:hypothetical protein